MAGNAMDIPCVGFFLMSAWLARLPHAFQTTEATDYIVQLTFILARQCYASN